MMNNTFDEIIEKFNTSNKIAVFCHARPDGDALGGALAITLMLKKLGKDACMCCEDLPPLKFAFLDTMKEVNQQLPGGDYDLFVSVDCADINRMGVFSKRFSSFKKTTVNIDHHISNNGYAKLNYVRVCPASCEIITDLFMHAGYETDADIANLLMVGLTTDSGNFSHLDVTEDTFKKAAYLRACGADVNLINYNLFSRQTKARALLHGKVMSKMRFALEDKLAYIVITQQDLADCSADKSLTEGFVDFPLAIDGVEVAMSILEYKPNQYKASLRSKGKVDVNAIASSFGGGGHILASGCMLFGPLEEVVERLTYAVSVRL